MLFKSCPILPRFSSVGEQKYIAGTSGIGSLSECNCLHFNYIYYYHYLLLENVTKVINNYMCRVIPSSRSSFIDINGDIMSCPTLSYIKIFHVGTAVVDFDSGIFKFNICLKASI